MAVATREYRAEAKFQRVSPQKARLVLDLIRGKGVEEALATAAFTKKRIAPVIHKLLRSAVDNARYVAGEQGTDLDVDSLYVKQALANDGPRMKRIRPAPMGRAYHYVRRIAHIEIVLAERNRNGAAARSQIMVSSPRLAPQPPGKLQHPTSSSIAMCTPGETMIAAESRRRRSNDRAAIRALTSGRE